MTTPNDPTIPHDSLDGVIAAYLQATDAAQTPRSAGLLDRYPEQFSETQSISASAKKAPLSDASAGPGKSHVFRHAAVRAGNSYLFPNWRLTGGSMEKCPST